MKSQTSFFINQFGIECVKVTLDKGWFVMPKSEWEHWKKLGDEMDEAIWYGKEFPKREPEPLDGFTLHKIEYDGRPMTAWSNEDRSKYYEFTYGNHEDHERPLDIEKVTYIRACRSMDI